MRRRILVVGRKSVEISMVGIPEGRVGIVERDVGVQRKLVLSEFEVGWKQNSRGEFVVAEVSLTANRGRIVIPASKYGTGWKDVASALHDFGQVGGEKEICKDDEHLKEGLKGTDNFIPNEKVTYLQGSVHSEVAVDELREIDVWWARCWTRREQYREPRSLNGGAITTGGWDRWCTGVLSGWVESGARVVRRREPIRYCDGSRCREMMGKDSVGEGNGTSEPRDRGETNQPIGVTRGSSTKEFFEKDCQNYRSGATDSLRLKRLGQSSAKYGVRDRVNMEKERWSLSEEIQRRRALGENVGRGRIGILKVLRTDMSLGWADYKKDAKGPHRGVNEMERRTGKWAKSRVSRIESRILRPAQDVGSHMKGLVGVYEETRGDTRSEEDITTSDMDERSSWKLGRSEQAEGRFEGPNDDIGKGKSLLIQVQSDDVIKERIICDIEPLECYQAEPISLVGPVVDEIRQDDGGDWLMERGMEMLKDVDTTIIRSLWGGRWVKWEGLRANGSAGGILLMWDSRVVTHSSSCLFENVEYGNKWEFVGVYGPHNRSDRLVIRPAERAGCQMQSRAMRDFSDYIMEEELIDLPLEGNDFTWNNGTTSSRLDRFLVCSEWEGSHLDVRQYSLPKVVSDHKPVFLVGGGIHRGPTPFRFENMWLQVEGFRDLVWKWWEGYEVSGSASFCLARKLRWLKEDLKRWNREVFGRVESRLANLMEELKRCCKKRNPLFMIMTSGSGRGKPKENSLYLLFINLSRGWETPPFPAKGPGLAECLASCVSSVGYAWHNKGAVRVLESRRKKRQSKASLEGGASMSCWSGEPLCIFYSRYGSCKFGPSCKFDHPMGVFTYNLTASSSDNAPVVRRLLGSSSGAAALALSSEGLVDGGSAKPRRLSLSESRQMASGDDNIDTEG
ncbi:zinc finger nuclease 3 [Actinidia rufa]|uniref:Zinc finger nuclease 3 n=1 Tax=Actinidia rufa TaxID=165716 RepID=A0A7J0GUR2_9ERIC|nr:zinc finger nuclease 3 [Actinidia rufa]